MHIAKLKRSKDNWSKSDFSNKLADQSNPSANLIPDQMMKKKISKSKCKLMAVIE